MRFHVGVQHGRPLFKLHHFLSHQAYCIHVGRYRIVGEQSRRKRKKQKSYSVCNILGDCGRSDPSWIGILYQFGVFVNPNSAACGWVQSNLVCHCTVTDVFLNKLPRGYSGPIPHQIGHLRKLTTLLLIDCKLTGTSFVMHPSFRRSFVKHLLWYCRQNTLWGGAAFEPTVSKAMLQRTDRFVRADVCCWCC